MMLLKLPTNEPFAGELQREVDRFEEIFAPPVLQETEARDRARTERRAAKTEVDQLQSALRNLREPQVKTIDGLPLDGPHTGELRRAIQAAEIRLRAAAQAYGRASEAEAQAFQAAVNGKVDEASPALVALLTLLLDALEPLQELQLHAHRHTYPMPSILTAVPALTVAARTVIAQFNGRFPTHDTE